MRSRAFGAASGIRSAPLSGAMERYCFYILSRFGTPRSQGLAGSGR